MFNRSFSDFQKLLTIAVLFYCLIALVLFAQRPPVSYDGYWHLKMGQDLLQYGLSPWIDHYSFTFQNKEITTVPVPFQLALAFLVNLAGEPSGFIYIKVIYVTLLMTVMFWYFRKINAPWLVVVLVMPFIVYFVNIRLIVRPEIFSNVLCVVGMILYLNAKQYFSTRQFIFICILLLFWVNYHSPIIGYIVIFGLFLDKAIELITKTNKDLNWSKWAIWGSTIFIIGALKHNGHHFIFTMFSLLSEDYSKYIKEYFRSSNLYSSSIMLYIFWAVSVYLVVWSLYKKQFGFALICAILTYFSWTTLRLVTSAVVVNVCILSYYLSQVSVESFTKLKPYLSKSMISISAIVAIYGYYTIADLLYSDFRNRQYSEQFTNKHYPVQVTSYLKHYRDGGNILNLLSNGGYLIYQLSPQYKIYIDGRTNILYPIQFLEHWMTLYTNAKLINEELDARNISYAIYENTAVNALRLSEVKKLGLDFSDDNYLLYARKDKLRFPIGSGLYVFPMCWRDEMIPSVQSEIVTYTNTMGDEKYDLGGFYRFINGYITSDDKSAYLKLVKPQLLQTETIKRLGAYMSLQQNDYVTSLSYFDAIVKKSDFDLLMMTNILINQKKYDLAENTLNYLYSMRSFYNINLLPLDKAFVYMNLIGKLHNVRPLKLQSPGFYMQLQSRIKKLTGINDLSKMALQPFAPYCATFRRH